MVKIDFKTPYFDYDVTLIQIEGSKDALQVCKYLTKNGIDKEVVDDVKEKNRWRLCKWRRNKLEREN